MTQRIHVSHTAKALEEAIDLDLEGRSPYPERAWFIDANAPRLDDAIQQAFDSDYAAILVSADGSTEILLPRRGHAPGQLGRRVS